MAVTWSTKASLPKNRQRAAGGVINDRLYVVGGDGGGGTAEATLYQYDPGANTWTTKAPKPLAVTRLAAVVLDGKLHAMGGYDGTYQSRHEAYDPSTDTWASLAALPAGRYGHVAGVVNGKIYVTGGVTADSSTDTLEYSPGASSWTKKAAPPSTGVTGAAGIGGLLYVLSGTALSAFDPAANTWTAKTSCPTDHTDGAVAVVNGLLYAIGGYTSAGAIAAVDVYDPSTDTWTARDPMPTGRGRLVNEALGTVLYAVGGWDNANAGAALAVVEAGQVNQPPNAPILTAPADGTTIDRNITQRFDWDFSDPDAGDSQSKYDLRYRVVGAATWTVVTGTTPNTFHDFAAGTFALGDYEWQAATKDAQGLAGPFSASFFFTAGDPPATPTITDPVSGGTVGSDPYTVQWSTPDQDAYQVRTVADNAGSPDATTVYQDTGEVVSATARARSMPFPVKDRYEHIQVRIKHGGLWSAWASIRVLVSYTPPPVPSLTITTSDVEAAVSVAITNPTPAAGEPPVTHNRLFVRASAANPDGDKYRPYPDGTRIEAQKPPNSTAIDYLAAGGIDYEYRAEAVGDNGTTSDSGWVGASAAAETVVYYGGGYDE
jgi:N-acetylneuraminic acid mutarotase